MVKIRGEVIPSELVGLEEPTPYIHALFSYTRKMDAERAKMEVSKAHEVSHPVDSLYHKIKVMSLMPSVYAEGLSHRTFKKVKISDVEGDRMTKKPSKAERREGLI